MDYVSTYKPSHFLINVLLKKCSCLHMRRSLWLQWKRLIYVCRREYSVMSNSLQLQNVIYYMKSESEVTQSYLTLCDPEDCGLLGSSVYGIFQARILTWVAISFSRGSSRLRVQTGFSHIARRLYHLSHQGIPIYYILCRELGIDLEVLHLDLLRSSLQQ